jgi:hypothetical protein
LADLAEGAAVLTALEKRGDLFTSPASAALILKLDIRTVYAGLKNNEIPHTRIGQKYSIPVAWLRQQTDGQ